ncbi:hypothetical protein [Micromonospora sp. NPDC005806]|uniref:hypothetical protein n=1 Tax=Micromonospora sp. NPDC005806 TaxID=3364234 RepID=UPI003686CFA2
MTREGRTSAALAVWADGAGAGEPGLAVGDIAGWADANRPVAPMLAALDLAQVDQPTYRPPSTAVTATLDLSATRLVLPVRQQGNTAVR